MTREEAIAIIHKEYLCVDRDCDIEKSCGKCDLMMPSKEPILQAYKMAIKALEQERSRSAEITQYRYDCEKLMEENERLKKALEQEPCETIHGSTYGGVSWGGTYKPQQPSEDCISRQAVLDEAFEVDTKEYGRIDVVGVDAIKSLPPVTPHPKMGHWIRWYEQKEHDRCTEYRPHCKCSECGKEYDPHSSQFIKYCNECGAKMQEVEDGNK